MQMIFYISHTSQTAAFFQCQSTLIGVAVTRLRPFQVQDSIPPSFHCIIKMIKGARSHSIESFVSTRNLWNFNSHFFQKCNTNKMNVPALFAHSDLQLFPESLESLEQTVCLLRSPLCKRVLRHWWILEIWAYNAVYPCLGAIDLYVCFFHHLSLQWEFDQVLLVKFNPGNPVIHLLTLLFAPMGFVCMHRTSMSEHLPAISRCASDVSTANIHSGSYSCSVKSCQV